MKRSIVQCADQYLCAFDESINTKNERLTLDQYASRRGWTSELTEKVRTHLQKCGVL
jgi:hypothetical protein